MTIDKSGANTAAVLSLAADGGLQIYLSRGCLLWQLIRLKRNASARPMIKDLRVTSSGEVHVDKSGHLVVTVHGIRTYGQWQSRLTKLLQESEPGITVRNEKYGYPYSDVSDECG